MSESRLSVLTVVTLAGAAVLFISACSLVTSQYRARSLVAQIEKLQNEERRLNDDASELYMEISRAALPGYIASGDEGRTRTRDEPEHGRSRI